MSSFDKMVDMAKESYVQVMGEDTWNNLTDQQKHDVVMIMWTDFGKAVEEGIK